MCLINTYPPSPCNTIKKSLKIHFRNQYDKFCKNVGEISENFLQKDLSEKNSHKNDGLLVDFF